MPASAAANDAFVRPSWEPSDDVWLGITLPKGHVGPVLLSATGRTIWWTGRVAIGLRYEPPRHADAPGRSAEWIQRVLLGCGQHSAVRRRWIQAGTSPSSSEASASATSMPSTPADMMPPA